MKADKNGRGPLGALAHPLRVRLVEACTEHGSLSPTEILKLGLVDDIEILKGKTHSAQVTAVNYHCKQLAEAGILALDRDRRVRGATEHFYTANKEARFEDQEWGALSKGKREGISQVVWHRKIAQVESAMYAKTFDSRVDRMLAWGPLILDEDGWSDVAEHMAECFYRIEDVRADAELRLQQPGAKAIRCNYGLLFYEMPTPPALKRPAAESDSDSDT